MEHRAETAMGVWSIPQCPFRIEYSARVLDEIRLAVVDAFFSVPRGGMEIGGLLLGDWDGERLAITAFEPLDCEHALGPSFTLSVRDQMRMAEMTAVARRNAPNRQPVGWYHSHTRSEIFLSETDQWLHSHFFPEKWQVALVLKPHTFEPTRAGFFFRAVDGIMTGTASYREFRLDPMPLRHAGGNGSSAPPPVETGARPTLVEAEPSPADEIASAAGKGKGRVPITREIAVEPPPADVQEAPGPAQQFDAPDFGQSRQEGSWRGFKAVAILAVGLVAGGAGYQTRQYWLPQVLTKVRGVLPKEPDSYLSLAVLDDHGQLKIQWDRNAPAVRNALEATLEITDGSTVPQAVRLDTAHLLAGSFTYARQSERVDVSLIASEPEGQYVKEQTSFLGRLPQQPGADDVQAGKDRDAEAQRAEKLQKDLNFQAAKTRKLEKDLKDMRDQLQKSNPAPDPTRKD
jgi:proteasome lid subunit RPN8/RPN11